MKLMDKYMKSMVVLTIFLIGIVRLNLASDYDSAIMEYIKKQKFNLELYELSFCSEEVLKVIESDTVHENTFRKRLNRAFDKRLNEVQVYFHTLEYHFFLNQISQIKNVKGLYPKSIQLIESLAPQKRDFEFKNFSFPFQNYIEYPEQVDDACIISLISDLPETAWNDIQTDKLALYRFNTWLEFGFEEFRYYPGIKSKAKAIINNRIINYLNSKYVNTSEALIVRSLDSINNTVKKYKK